MKRVLGLDIATTTGGCYLWDGDPQIWTWKFTGTRGEKASQLEDQLLVALADYNPELVAFEEAEFFRGSGSKLLIGLQIMVEKICEEMKVTYVSVPVPTLKKFATGTGKHPKGQSKKMMIAAALEATGLELTADEADAYWVARWAQENALDT